ncbi:hypothetical protein BJ508DRAFT_326111 [Ascobolus immersus RN42]|uniref:Uncharacterized protein n=1 Tax=Ascobolus immersus RN42 TaxID=1160509 RepID=A0A3N4ICK9_ASCIM|nr:hypothetical protein BJ508DRAFT_326111 [Ascobolus immersus RN42]
MLRNRGVPRNLPDTSLDSPTTTDVLTAHLDRPLLSINGTINHDDLSDLLARLGLNSETPESLDRLDHQYPPASDPPQTPRRRQALCSQARGSQPSNLQPRTRFQTPFGAFLAACQRYHNSSRQHPRPDNIYVHQSDVRRSITDWTGLHLFTLSPNLSSVRGPITAEDYSSDFRSWSEKNIKFTALIPGATGMQILSGSRTPDTRTANAKVTLKYAYYTGNLGYSTSNRVMWDWRRDVYPNYGPGSGGEEKWAVQEETGRWPILLVVEEILRPIPDGVAALAWCLGTDLEWRDREDGEVESEDENEGRPVSFTRARGVNYHRHRVDSDEDDDEDEDEYGGEECDSDDYEEVAAGIVDAELEAAVGEEGESENESEGEDEGETVETPETSNNTAVAGYEADYFYDEDLGDIDWSQVPAEMLPELRGAMTAV